MCETTRSNSAHDGQSPSGQAREPHTAVDAWDWRLLAVAALFPLLVLVVLHAFRVPLGKPDKFVYLYSPPGIVSHRVAAVPAAIGLAALPAGGVWLAFSGRRRRRRAGLVLVAAGCVALGVWAYCAPPAFRWQHFFNMQSPSHDGAFFGEAYYARRVGLKGYLHDFPQRARTPPEEMRGTRVISNPPGATLIAVGTSSVLERSPRLRNWVSTISVDAELPTEMVRLVTVSLGFALGLQLLWLLAAPFLYWSARVFLSAPAAAVFAIVCMFSPMTLLFAPGKDAAQLLTVAVPLWLWLRAWRRQEAWTAVLAGALFMLACLLSLVHIWIAAIVFVASAVGTPASAWQKFALRTCLPAVAGAFAVIGILRFLCNLDVYASAWAAACGQAAITRSVDAMPLVWQMLGVPLFLLFAGPALWCVGLWLPRRHLYDVEARFGCCLSLGAVAVMLATVGFTNLETPRLWIPFTPLLLLGAALQLSVFRQPDRRAAALLATLVFVQLAASAVQWSLMDMREAETRLLHDEHGNARFFE